MIVHQGKNIEDVLCYLTKHENCKIIAGGTDLIIQMREKKISPGALIDISSIQELKEIKEEDDFIEIGAAVTFADIVESPVFDGRLYGLKKACKLVGSPQIRNMGTIGGNIINGSPAADSVPPLLCLNSILVFRSLKGLREVKLEDYFKYKDQVGIREDEVLTAIRFRRPEGYLNFAKLGLRKALAISRISMAAMVYLDEEGRIRDIAIASGSLGKYPMRERRVEEYLLGKELNERTIDEGLEVLIKATDERLMGRSTYPYKRRAVESLFREVLRGMIG
jgi:carbon-monoxide dehydrogenase medium subunit/xanthine dehydrogenase FAD-binding subunit